MTTTIALIPLVSLLALTVLYVAFVSYRASRIASLQAEHDEFTKCVLHQDATLQQELVAGLLEGRSLPECLEEFQKRRAALLPTVSLDDPSGWDAEQLQNAARRQFNDHVAEANRRLGTRFAFAAVAVIAACLAITSALYHVRSTIPSASPLPPWTAPQSLTYPAATPVMPSAVTQPSSPASSPDNNSDPTGKPAPTGTAEPDQSTDPPEKPPAPPSSERVANRFAFHSIRSGRAILERTTGIP